MAARMGLHFRITHDTAAKLEAIVAHRRRVLHATYPGTPLSQTAVMMSLIEEAFAKLPGDEQRTRPAPATAPAPPAPVAVAEAQGAIDIGALRERYAAALDAGDTCTAIAKRAGIPHWKVSGFAAGRRIDEETARNIKRAIEEGSRP